MFSCTWIHPRTHTCFDVELTHGVDLSIPITPYVSRSQQANAFGLPAAEASPVRLGNFVGSVEAGASVNCPVIQICPHGNGTHTECVGHIVKEKITLGSLNIAIGRNFHPCLLIDVTPKPFSSAVDEANSYPAAEPADLVIDQESIKEGVLHATAEMTENEWGEFTEVVVIRSQNGVDLRQKQWGGVGAPYFTKSAMEYLKSIQCLHVIVDLPSMDKEDDQGYLVAHKTFWEVVEGDALTLSDRSFKSTITELANIPGSCKKGRYFLQLQVSPVDADAAPSRPVLFPMSQNRALVMRWMVLQRIIELRTSRQVPDLASEEVLKEELRGRILQCLYGFQGQKF